jgi:hypothetical protein
VCTPAVAEDEERKRAIISSRRAAFNDSLASRAAASPEELASLKAEFEREADAVANAVADERRRQQDQLQARLAAKRDRQRRAIERRQSTCCAPAPTNNNPHSTICTIAPSIPLQALERESVPHTGLEKAR